MVLAEPDGLVVPGRVLELGENILVSERLAVGIDVGVPAGHVKERGQFLDVVLNVTQGYYINILRVRSSGVLSRHRHSGPVHAFTLRGRWRYLEHNWVASPGDYAFEPPGETHTLVVPDDVKEMATLFHVTGGYTYVDPYGEALGYEDVFSKLEHASRHYEAIGLGKEHVKRIVR